MKTKCLFYQRCKNTALRFKQAIITNGIKTWWPNSGLVSLMLGKKLSKCFSNLKLSFFLRTKNQTSKQKSKHGTNFGNHDYFFKFVYDL